MRNSANSRAGLWSRSLAMRSRTAGSAADAVILSPPENSAERTANDRPSNTLAGRAGDGFTDSGRKFAGNFVGDRTRHVARDCLGRGQSGAAPPVGAVKAAEKASDCSQNTVVRGLRDLTGRRHAPSGHVAILQTSLQDFIGRLRIDGLLVFALERTSIDHRLALFRGYRTDARR